MKDFFCEDSVLTFIAFLVKEYFKVERAIYFEHGDKTDVEFTFPLSLFEEEPCFDFWKDKMKEYSVKDRCKCNSLEYSVCSTVELEHKRGRDFFVGDYFLLNSNIGFFIFHIDENGCLNDCELLFKEEIVPSFLPCLIKNFPNEDDSRSDLTAFNEIKSRKIYSVFELCRMFNRKKLNVIEIE